MTFRRSLAAGLLGAILFFGVGGRGSFAEEPRLQPYIDYLKKNGEVSASGVTEESTDAQSEPSYSETVKKDLEEKNPTPQWQKTYIESVISQDPPRFQKFDQAESYSESRKKTLEPFETGGAIQAFQEGRSELHARRSGEIHHAMGFRYGASLIREIQGRGDLQRRAFNDVYGSNYALDVGLFYEYQPFHSEWLGNIGIVGMLGLSYFRGLGQFGYSIGRSSGVAVDPNSARTEMKLFAIPLTVGVNYRFNLLRIIRPYVFVGPSLVGLFEFRDDYTNSACRNPLFQWVKGNCLNSKAVLVSVGASVLLDWLSPSTTWDLYAGNGIQHYYLSVDYSRYFPLEGDVLFNVYGFTAGLTFEY